MTCKTKHEARTDWRFIVICILLAPFSLMAGSNQAGNAWAWGLSILANGSLQTPPLTIGSVPGDLSGSQDGAFWYDSTRKGFRGDTAAGLGGLGLLFTPPVADSTPLANPTSATAFSTKVTLPANALTVGKVGRARAYGKFTSGTAITPTVNLGLRLGGAAFASSGLIPISISLTDQAWMIEGSFTVRTIGPTGTAFGWARAEVGGLLGLTTPTSMVARSGSKTIATDGALDIEASALFGASDAANAITLEGLEVELYN